MVPSDVTYSQSKEDAYVSQNLTSFPTTILKL